MHFIPKGVLVAAARSPCLPQVDYDDNFKLYVSTKMANPHYFPEVCIKVRGKRAERAPKLRKQVEEAA